MVYSTNSNADEALLVSMPTDSVGTPPKIRMRMSAKNEVIYSTNTNPAH